MLLASPLTPDSWAVNSCAWFPTETFGPAFTCMVSGGREYSSGKSCTGPLVYLCAKLDVSFLGPGIIARQRKMELERLNEQLRKINMSLRQNARAGIVYAPGLTYAPPATDSGTSGEKLDGGGATSSAAPDTLKGV